MSRTKRKTIRPPTASCLASLAPFELLLVAQTEAIATQCRESVAAAQRRCQESLATVPPQLQEERQALITAARSEADRRAAAIASEAEKRAARLADLFPRLTGEVTRDLCRRVVPGTPASVAREGRTA